MICDNFDLLQCLPKLMELSIHEVEDGRRFWGQLVDEESVSALKRIHAVLLEAAK